MITIMNKFNVGDEVRVFNPLDDLCDCIGTVKESYGNDYLVVFKEKGMKFFYESELILFNKKYGVGSSLI